jgi:hypothetical protein
MTHRKAPPVKHDDPTMRGQRSRDITGELRQKRGDTLVKTIEEIYDVNLGVRTDMKLETLRERLGETGIAELIKKSKK